MHATRENVERCCLCRAILERKGDDWGELCPNCADAVSQFLDNAGLTDAHVDDVIGFAQGVIEHARRHSE